MLCTKCNTENRGGRRFCAGCGAVLASACAKCGFGNEPGERFCGGCGAPLQAEAPAPERSTVGSAAAQSAAPTAERRQLTVLFSDLVGSTALSTQLDPEDLRRVIRTYERHCADVVARYGGIVAQFMGDGVMAFFGYPLAHEDDAERALRAALEIADSVKHLQPHPGVALATRVGVATGLVVVGEVIATAASHQYAVSGETPNLAARLQSLAEPNQVVASDATRRLASGAFRYLDLGTPPLKGIATPVNVWHVTGASAAETRFDAAQAGGGAPLIGRDHERGLLQERWEQAAQGEGQVVLLSGEAGIGKSRMVQTLYESTRDEACYLLRYQCLAYYANSALYPVIRQLERAAAIEPHLDDAEKLGRLECLLAEAAPEVTDIAPVFAALLGIAATGRNAALDLPAQKLKERTFNALVAQLRGLAARKPVLFVLEDAHWIDPTTLELLERLIGLVAEQRVLLVVTFRPDFTPPWVRHSHVTQLALNRLPRRHCSSIISEITRGRPLPEQVLEQVLARTDGIPLFVEEQTKMVLESGLVREEDGRFVLACDLQDLAIPASLQDSLMARLDRLGEAKELAQVCAVIGRDVPHDVAAAVVAADGVAGTEAELQSTFEKLLASGLFINVSEEARPVYSFRHALIQDAAYGSMLKTRRQELHLAVAQALEARFPERAANEPETVAFHYTEAGHVQPAFANWQRAGQRANARAAMREAVAHYRRALDSLQSWPEDAARKRLELETQIALGIPLIAARGYTDQQVYEVYLRARALADELNDHALQFSALWGLWTCHRARLEMHQARELAGELNRLASEAGDTSRLLAAHHAQWTTYIYLGELTTAAEHCEQGVRLYDSDRHHQHVFIYGGHDPGVCGLATAALDVSLLGRIGEAMQRIDDARKLAERLSHPATVAHALAYSALLAQFLRDPQATLDYAEHTLEIARRIELPGYVSAATMLAAWARSAQGRGAGSVTEIRRCTENNLFMVAGVTRPYFLAMLAEAQVDAGDSGAALDTIKTAVDEIEQHQMRLWESELYRMRGNILERDPGAARERVERCYRKACDVAQVQGAKLLELRACVSLARLLTSIGRAAEGRDRLAQLVAGFTAEPASSDVLEARRALAIT